MVQSRVGEVLGELQPVGSPHRINLGRTPCEVGMGSDHGEAAETKHYEVSPLVVLRHGSDRTAW